MHSTEIRTMDLITQQSCSDRYTTSVDVDRVYHLIYVRLHNAVWLELSRPHPLRRAAGHDVSRNPRAGTALKWGFKFKPPGPVLPGCQ